VVLNINMPGMDGVQVAEVLKTERPTLPVVIWSAGPEEIPESLKWFADALLYKGDGPLPLLLAIDRILKDSRRRNNPAERMIPKVPVRTTGGWEIVRVAGRAQSGTHVALRSNNGVLMNPVQTHVNWPQLYRAAVLELDNEKVLVRIGLAEKAIHGRLRELAGDGNGSGEEKRKIERSLAILHLLLKHEVQRKVQESTCRSESMGARF
jgi:DNA-binding response OmpR family regulator